MPSLLTNLIREHTVRGKLAGSYSTILAAFSDGRIMKKLWSKLYIDKDQGYHLLFYVQHNHEPKREFDGLAKAVRAYDKIGMIEES
jgi:hypothetical protein